MKFIILGCGSSMGVPRPDGYFGNCDPTNLKNYRTRCSALIKSQTENILIDTSPDLRQQLLRHNIKKIDKVFIGSCTNGRIEDLRSAANLLKGKKVADNVSAIVVPGSGLVKAQAEEEGLDKIYKEAGFEWREPGCSMCLAMNPDQLKPGERCAATSNRNFEGRQGRGGRTHLMSPQMAAAAAVTGKLTDVRNLI